MNRKWVQVTLWGNANVLKLSKIFEPFCVQIMSHKTDFEELKNVVQCPSLSKLTLHRLSLCQLWDLHSRQSRLLKGQEKKRAVIMGKGSILNHLQVLGSGIQVRCCSSLHRRACVALTQRASKIPDSLCSPTMPYHQKKISLRFSKEG